MEDSKSVIPGPEGEENLIVAAHNMARALGMRKNLNDDERKILMNLGIQLFTMSTQGENKESGGISDLKKQLDAKSIDDETANSLNSRNLSFTISRVNRSKGEGLSEIEGHFRARASGSMTNDDRKLPINLPTQLSTIPTLNGKEMSGTEKRPSPRMIRMKENQADDDERKISIDLGTHSPTIPTLNRNNEKRITETEEGLNVVEAKIMSWEANLSRKWDFGEGNILEYVNAEEEVWKFIESPTTLSIDESGDDRIFSLDEVNELLQTPHNVFQMDMERLEEEFRHLLTLNKQTFDAVSMSWRSSEGDVVEEHSIIISENYQDSNSLWGESMSRFSEGNIIDLVHPDVIPQLKRIAKLMFNSNYGEQCCQTYICIRKDALDDCLFLLEMEKLSTTDAIKMEWGILSTKIRKQIRAMKIFVRGFLASEKRLCEEVFGELGSVSSVCFLEVSKISMLQLVSFCEAIAVGPHLPEMLFRILDLYQVLADLLPDIDALFSDEAASPLRMECHEAVTRLGECVKPTFLELENAIASETSAKPFASGAVLPLTRYVMHYIKALTGHIETLNLLLKDQDKEDSISSSPDASPAKEEGSNNGISTPTTSPMALRFRSVTSILEANLDIKSELYGDASLQHLFLMNNIHYMAQKVKNSELRDVLGDEWIRNHNLKFQHYAMNYEIATWSSVLSLLKANGLHIAGSYSVPKICKERLRSFNVAFEKVYKTQTAWLIPDDLLRKDLQISIAVKVIQAYWSFVRRFGILIGEKFIKYTVDDLENFLFDLFEGSPRSIQNSHKR